MKKKNYPYSNIQISNGNVRIPHYSKVAVLSATNSPPFVPYGEQNMGLLEQQSLSNSEPSVADFDVGNGSEPLMPYCKFGLARSAGNGLNMSNQPLSVNPKTGYSKFGTVFRALKRQDSNTIPHLNDGLQSCPKFLPHNPQTFTALTVSNHPQGKQPLMKDNDKAYSKFGVSAPKNIPVNGYIFFKDILSYPSADSGANQAYSKLGMSANKTSQPENDHPKENGVIISAAELQAVPHSSQNMYNPLENTKDANNSFCREVSSTSKSEAEQPVANHKTLLEKDNSVEEEDKDCVIPDSSTSLLDEITPGLGNKLKPTNFTISASNDTKGFMLQDDSSNEPATQLTNFIDAVFDAYDFHIPDSEIMPISIDMEDLNIPNSDSEDCEHTCNLVTKSNGCIAKDPSEVICNGHSSPLPNLSTDYVPVRCNPAC